MQISRKVLLPASAGEQVTIKEFLSENGIGSLRDVVENSPNITANLIFNKNIIKTKYTPLSQQYMESLVLLERAVHQGQSTGAYNLQESYLLFKAIENIKHENESNKRKEKSFQENNHEEETSQA